MLRVTGRRPAGAHIRTRWQTRCEVDIALGECARVELAGDDASLSVSGSSTAAETATEASLCSASLGVARSPVAAAPSPPPRKPQRAACPSGDGAAEPRGAPRFERESKPEARVRAPPEQPSTDESGSSRPRVLFDKRSDMAGAAAAFASYELLSCRTFTVVLGIAHLP
eukprot:3118638-Pleurochrysis_carterae.AAC.1